MAKNTFYIKTLEVLNKYGKSLSANGPILVEQVFGNFDQVRLYDTSYVQNKEKIYFFKRHFIDPEEYGEDGIQRKPTEEEIDELDSRGVSQIQNSILILHEYDFKNSKEKIVQEIYIRESDLEEETMGRRQSVGTKKEMSRQQMTRKTQYHVSFS